ncbi:MAG: TonB-dependent receptor, partial [Bacteroidales bacterium]|nr:TonB-dependent receptor [Bacteroidales bacterium]
TPDLYVYFTMQYTPTRKLSLSLTGTYSGSMLVQHMESSGAEFDTAVETPSFFDANFKIAYDFRLFQFAKMQLHAGVLNIFDSFQNDFDKGVERDSGYMYGPMMPRSLYCGLKIAL